MTKAQIMSEAWSWEPQEKGFDQTREINAARDMVLSDLEVMSVDEFLTRKSSDIVYELSDAMIHTIKDQLDEVVSMKNIEQTITELGIEQEEESIPYKNVVDAVHLNYMLGCGIIGHYLSLMEHIKLNIDGQD